MKKIFMILITMMISLSACAGTPNALPTLITEQISTQMPLPLPTATVGPLPSETATSELTDLSPTPTTAPKIQSCALFVGESNITIMERISNPFYRPVPGSDNPHQGVDFSELDLNTRIALSGKPVQAILPGTIRMVLEDQFPYGNAILVETEWNELPEAWLSALDLPKTVEREISHTNLTCPGTWEDPGGDPSSVSLYILYAHFETLEELRSGESLICGQTLGTIGMTGNALAPHVHVEFRLGPAGAIFEEIAHYDASASLTAMQNYCRWRVSGWYALLDPMEYLLLP